LKFLLHNSIKIINFLCISVFYRNRDGKIYYDEFYQLFDDLNKKYKEFLEINQNSSEIMISGKMSKLFSINGIFVAFEFV
jgi:hypothetical protein